MSFRPKNKAKNKSNPKGPTKGPRFERSPGVAGAGRPVDRASLRPSHLKPLTGAPRIEQSVEPVAPRTFEPSARAPSRGGGRADGRSGKKFGKDSGKRGGKRSGARPDQRGSKRSGKREDGRVQKTAHGAAKKTREFSNEPGALTLRATVEKNPKGFAFLVFGNRDFEDLFVPPRDAQAFFPGDRVEVKISAGGHVQDIKVIEHRFKEMVGKFQPDGKRKGGFCVYEHRRVQAQIFLSDLGGTSPALGDWIRIKLLFPDPDQDDRRAEITGKVVECFGPTLPPSADVGMIAAEFSLIEEHTPEAITQAESFGKEIDPAEFAGREDLRKVPFITIDGETARDFDDAVYVEKNAKGDFILWVAIADVSHYVKEGNVIDKEAFARATSVYFPERAFHMLPRPLSENLCSLKPKVNRFAMVAKMQIDREGKTLSTELMEAIIESKRRATYNEIQKEYEANRDRPVWEYAVHFELFKILRASRFDRGSIDFDLPEAELLVKPTGEVISIRERARFEAHKLIEEFMIAANEAVSEWLIQKNWPAIFRVHEPPTEMALKKYMALAATQGVDLNFKKITPKAIADALKRIEGSPAYSLLNIALLRSMKQAVYQAINVGHFGLASNAYSHFTSPIRRYPDLIIHRLVRNVLQSKGQLKDRAGLEKKLDDQAEHCSYRERLASDAERESIKLKQVRAIEHRIGEEFDGVVTGMTENGMFVKLSDPFVEGMVTRESMRDDAYEFKETELIFIGRRKRQVFRIGDPIRVQVARADIGLRQIDFERVVELSPKK